MFDGVVRTLGNVRYVPHLKRNMISLSILDSKGYKYICKGEVSKIGKGTRIIMKGKRGSIKLYVLQGSIVTSDVIFVAPSM